MPKQLETRLKIVDVVNEMMRTERLDRLRVVEVCKRADISRTTFYSYFADIPDVPTWFWDHLMEQTLYRIGTAYGCYEAHLRKFRTIREHREFFANSFALTSYLSVSEHGGRQMTDIYTDVLARKLGRPLERSEALQMEFFVTGAKIMTRSWAEGGMANAPELMAEVFTSAMPEFAVPLLEPDGTGVPGSERRDGLGC